MREPADEHQLAGAPVLRDQDALLGQRHGEQLLTKGRVETIDQFVAALEAVDASQIRSVATDIFVNDRFHCAAVGPDLNEDEIANALSG